jgi:hypothetical protein
VKTPHRTNKRRFGLVGLAEVAEILELSKAAVCDRRKQHYVRGDKLPPFPAPLAELACGPVWERAAIESYAAEERLLASLSWFQRRYPGADPLDLIRTDLPDDHPFFSSEEK